MAVQLSQSVAVVLAGGFGTRIRHLLPGIPKPMAPVAGRPFLEWVARYLVRQGVSRAVFSTGYLSEVIDGYFATNPVPGITIQCIAEPEPLGTGGGFLHAVRGCRQTPEAWLVLNGDSLAFANLAEMAACLANPACGGAILARPLPEAGRYGTLSTSPKGELLGFAEKRPGPGMINAGTYLFRHAWVEWFPQKLPMSMETEAFPFLINQGAALRVFAREVPFLDIGTPESLAEAEAFIQQNQGEFSPI